MVLNSACSISQNIESYTNLKTLCLKLQIIDQKVIEVTSTKKLFPHQNGLDLLKSPFLDGTQPAFYLLSDSGKILLILWQPVDTKDKIIYAASAPIIKAKFPLLHREYHASTEEDLESIKQSVRSSSASDRHLAMSAAELEREEMLKSQEDEREEMSKQLEGHLTKFQLTRPEQHENQCEHGGIFKQTIAALSGGFHPIQMKLTDCAKMALTSMIQSETLLESCLKYLELRVCDGGNQIDSVVTKTVPVSDVEMLMPFNTTEPRFYYYLLEQNGNLVRVFTYICPSQANPRLKMLYSSAKAGLLKDLQKLSNSPFDLRLDYFDEQPLTLRYVLTEYNDNVAANGGKKLSFSFVKPIMRKSRPPSRILNSLRTSFSHSNDSLSPTDSLKSPVSDTLAAVQESETQVQDSLEKAEQVTVTEEEEVSEKPEEQEEDVEVVQEATEEAPVQVEEAKEEVSEEAAEQEEEVIEQEESEETEGVQQEEQQEETEEEQEVEQEEQHVEQEEVEEESEASFKTVDSGAAVNLESRPVSSYLTAESQSDQDD